MELDPLCTGFLLTLYLLPVIGLFALMALIANIIELYLEWRN